MTAAQAIGSNPGGEGRHRAPDPLDITPSASGKRQANAGTGGRGQTAEPHEETRWMQTDPESPGTGDSKSQRHELIAKVIIGDQGLKSLTPGRQGTRDSIRGPFPGPQQASGCGKQEVIEF